MFYRDVNTGLCFVFVLDVVVNCDKCTRKAIQADRLCFYHCALCSYDLCFTCSLPSPSSTSKSSTEPGTGTAPKLTAVASMASTSTQRSPLTMLGAKSPAFHVVQRILDLARMHILQPPVPSTTNRGMFRVYCIISLIVPGITVPLNLISLYYLQV